MVRRLPFGFLLGFAMIACVGCGDRCGDASSECIDDRTLLECTGSVDAFGASRHLVEKACDDVNPYCVTLPDDPSLSPYERAHRGICTAEREPSGACTAASGKICADGREASCKERFLVRFAVTATCS